MKAILISIKPKWVAKILNGEKTIEIRKTMPKCELPIDVYIYCTKEEFPDITLYSQENEFGGYMEHTGNGKVVAKFTLNKVEKFCVDIGCVYDIWQEIDKTCLTKEEICDYILGESKYQNVGYAWHIHNLEIFDKPKDIHEFIACEYRKPVWKPIGKAPQSWCYVEVLL